ncbi:MAG: SxtJ family membrane protein [Acidobacteriota bacterium]|nr:SxtJ family membrane protein [Acidobacteriota bacterium]
MAIIEINTDPSKKELRWFGAMLVVFVLAIGVLVRWQFDAPTVAQRIWIAGGLLSLVYVVVPSLRRWIFVGWIYAAFPIGWTVSHVLLASIYYLVFTPIGLLLRLIKGDPLERRLDRSAASYWRPHESLRDVRRYFRQF